MIGRNSFSRGVVLMLLLGVLDLVITWILTPSLKNEGNVFVTQYGFGWLELILVSIGFILFVSIPYYYYCLGFNYQAHGQGKWWEFSYLGIFLFKNDKNLLLSILKACFCLLGFFLFWRYVITKTTAIIYNLLLIKGAKFEDHSFAERLNSLNFLDRTLLILALMFFVFSLVYKPLILFRAQQSRRQLNMAFIFVFFGLFLGFKAFTTFAKRKHSVGLTKVVDPDIVLINIHGCDRVKIAKAIKALDSCRPAVIAIDVFFEKELDPISDSILVESLKSAKNDILSVWRTGDYTQERSHEKFANEVTKEGLVYRKEVNGLVSSFVPIKRTNGVFSESFAYQVIKLWQPSLKLDIKVNKTVTIDFTRAEDAFVKFDAADFVAKDYISFLKDKIVLMGYLGPEREAKYFTPIRNVRNYLQNEPDTYSIVILANEIRTILKYEEKE